MNVSESDLKRTLEAFGEHRIEIVAELAHEGRPDGIGTALLLALGSRETNFRNIAGDSGHGRGWLQIDDRFHTGWLRSHAGCESGKWKAKFASALPPGRVPTLTGGTLRAIEILRQNIAFAAAHGVPASQRVRFAVAAYNGGPGNALAGFRKGKLDEFTTGHDYSKDVFQRKEAITRFLKSHSLPV
jgi:hypothetical protein